MRCAASSFKLARRRQRSVDERAAAAVGGNLAPDQDLFVPTLENRLDAGGVLAGPDEVAGRAAAEQQVDCSDENRLAGAGFAGQDVQAGVEFDLDRIDDRQMGDAKETKHRKRGNSNPNIGLTAVFVACYSAGTIWGLRRRGH